MDGKAATTLRMQRAARQTGAQPGLLRNILFAAVFTCGAQLQRPHRPVAPVRNPRSTSDYFAPPVGRITGGAVLPASAGGSQVDESNNSVEDAAILERRQQLDADARDRHPGCWR